MCSLDNRPTSEHQHADCAPRKRRTALERAGEGCLLARRGSGTRCAATARRGSEPSPTTTSANECGGSGRRVSGRATNGRFDRSISRNERERTGVERALDRQKRLAAARKENVLARRSDRVSWVRGRSRGCLIACASSPHSQRRIYDETTHLEPRRTANSSVASIVNCAGGGYQPVLDRVSADRRAYCIQRLLQVTLQRPGPLGVVEGRSGARSRRPKVY